MRAIAVPGLVPCVTFAAIIATAVSPAWWNLAPMAVALAGVFGMWRAIFAVSQIRYEDYTNFCQRLWDRVPTKAMELKALGLRDRFEREGDYKTAKRCEEDAEALRRGEIPPSMERE